MDSFSVLDILRKVPANIIALDIHFQVVGASDVILQSLDTNLNNLLGKNLRYIFENTNGLNPTDNRTTLLNIEEWLKTNLDDLTDNTLEAEFAKRFKGLSLGIYPNRSHKAGFIMINFDCYLTMNPDNLQNKRESSFEAMASETEVLISMVSEKGILEYQNKAWEQFAAPAEKNTDRFPWDKLIHPDDNDHIKEVILKAIPIRSGFNLEFRILHQDQKYHWIKVKGTPRLNSDRTFAGYICTGIDITDIKLHVLRLDELNQQLILANQQLWHSEDRLQAAFDAAEIGSCSLDIASGKAEMSERYRKHYGLPLDGEINWDMVMEAVEPEYHDEVNQVLYNAATYGSPVDSVYPIRHIQTGERKWMHVVGKVNKGTSGIFESVYAVVMDITIKMEEEQRKNAFLAMISHELKTPLTSINGYLQLLNNDINFEHDLLSERIISKIRHQIKKLTAVINSFLDVERLDRSDLHLKPQVFDIAELIYEVEEEFNTKTSSHTLSLSNVRSHTIIADRDKIWQVLSNFLSNAVKFSDRNSEIIISCKYNADNVTLAVSDYGIGIHKDDLPHLFERYFRVQNKESDSRSGIGIGLYLCSEIIKCHGGLIWADNNDGCGSIFSFSLPINNRS